MTPDLGDETPNTVPMAEAAPLYTPYIVKTTQQGILHVSKMMGLQKLTTAEILRLYEHPAMLVSHAHSKGVKCGFTLAADILVACGWKIPKDIHLDPAVPPQSMKKHLYAKGEVVPLSRFFMEAQVGDTIMREIKGRQFKAVVLPNGKLSSEDFEEGTALSPTKWARLVLGREGRMPIMPRQFWKSVRVVKIGDE